MSSVILQWQLSKGLFHVFHLCCQWQSSSNSSSFRSQIFINTAGITKYYFSNLITSLVCSCWSGSESLEYLRYCTTVNIPSIPSPNFSSILTTVYNPVCMVYTVCSSSDLTWVRQSPSKYQSMYRWESVNIILLTSWLYHTSSSPYAIDTTAHCGLWPVEQCPSIFSYLPPTLPTFSFPALEELFLLPLSILFWFFSIFSSLSVLEWRFFWASYPPPFSLGDLTSLSFALLSILLYFILCSSLLVLRSSDFSIPRFHI